MLNKISEETKKELKNFGKEVYNEIKTTTFLCVVVYGAVKLADKLL